MLPAASCCSWLAASELGGAACEEEISHRQPLLQLLAGDEAAARHHAPLLAEGSLPTARRGVPLLAGWGATARSPHVRGRRAARHDAYCPQPVAAPSDHTTSCMEKRGWPLQEAAPSHWMYNPAARMPSWQHVYLEMIARGP
ncbi:hypothetical protein Dimus_024520 [Dionaea muscipula]